jgi:hypothetical protein
MVNAPAQREPGDVDLPAESAVGSTPGTEPVDARRLWQRVATRAVGVPLVVLAPLIALAPTADHRFNVYWHGADFLNHPLHLVTENVRTIPLYFDRGNFRPLGRMLEGGVDLAAFLLMELLDLPANEAFRLVSFLAAAVLTVAAVVFAESVLARGRLFGSAPSRLAATVPFAVGAGFVAAGATSTTVLFGGLYLLSTALVITVAAVACRAVTTGVTRLGRVRGILAVLAGAALAAFNELAYLALPLAVVAVLVRGRIVLGLGWRPMLTGAGARLVGLLWLGFLPVFIPVRAIIYGNCADGDCYTGSDLAIGGDALVTWPNRMLSWLPPLTWQTATRGADGSWLVGLLPLVALLLLALLAWRTALDLPRLSPVDRRQAYGLAVVAAVLLALGAALAALNGEVQAAAVEGRWGLGWRDSGVTGVGGALVVLALYHAVLGRAAQRRRQQWAAIALLLLTGVATVSAAANKSYSDATGSGRSAILNNRIAQEIADFDTTAAGNERRCALRAQFAAAYQMPTNGDDAADLPGARTALGRFDATLNMATRRLDGRPFCSGGKP